MAACTFVLTQILFISWFLMAHCSQPNCTSVQDFYDCRGNTTGFCPESIVCACKDGKPFCKCPNFRGQWGDYWYMGEKCDQLWNTLDLVLVATLPGIALAIIVGVVIQIVHYCKRKSKKNGNHHGVQRSMSELRPQHNSAYGFGTDRNLPQPNQGENPWSLFNPEAFSATSFSPSSQLSRTNSNFIAQEDSLYNSPYPNWNVSPERSNPAANSGNNHLSTMYTKPNFDFSISGVPRAAYPPKEKKYSVYEGSEIPYKIGRANMISNY
ncbi:uncharacterized protein LOC127675699 isoform X2 [Apodemus sylvaticus]|uniref:uncharacterized protein LOC127675699 isoform X2 n=1 Tax=Apodemus sylvaticus TaxID=10129 RepID=UPI002244A59E|nr:uncharacterized protein LOC127675699 isoform X2 [Apodemus sylvaticus]